MHDLKKAHALLEELNTFREHLDSTKNLLVIGVSLASDSESHSPIQLQRMGGIGRLASSIGYPDELKMAMTEAFRAWLRSVENAKLAELQSLGVDIK